MENGPKIRIVGGASEEKKGEARQKIKNNLFNHIASLPEDLRKDLETSEHEKHPMEIEMIHLANEETSRLMKEAGLEPYDVPVENIHIVPQQLYEKLTGNKRQGRTKRGQETILLNSAYLNSPMSFYSTMVHELLHLKAHLSLEIKDDGYDHIHDTVYRKGVTTLSSQKKEGHGEFTEHFEGLHEAIVTETERRLVFKMLSVDALVEERDWVSSKEAKDAREKIAKENNIPEEDIIWINPQDHTQFENLGYTSQRKVFNYVCAEISKQFPDQFKTPENVYKLFLNANFTGQLLPIARLVEKTFGPGSFRVLGNMGTDKESPLLQLDLLKKARAQQTTP